MSSKKEDKSKRFKSIGELLFLIYKEGSIKSEIMERYQEIRRIIRLKLIRDEGDYLEITTALKGLCDLAIAFKNRELLIGEIAAQSPGYSWLVPLLRQPKLQTFPLYLPNEDILREVYRKFPNFVTKRLQKLRHSALRELKNHEKRRKKDNVEDGRYKITVLGTLSKMLYPELLRVGIKLKPVIAHGTEDVVDSVIDGRTDIAFPVPQFRIDEIKENNKSIYPIPVNLNVQTPTYVPKGYKPTRVKGWVAEYSTERAVSVRILAESTDKKFELCDSFEEVISKALEGYGIVLPTTSGVILENKLWTTYECYIPLRKYYVIVNKESVPMSVIERIEKAVKMLERNVRTNPSAMVDAMLASPKHVLKEFKQFYKLVR